LIANVSGHYYYYMLYTLVN